MILETNISDLPKPFMVLQCSFVDKGYVEPLILQKFGIKVNMRVMISFSNIYNKVNKKNDDLLPFWKNPNYMENWESKYDNPEIIPTQTQGMLILNGYYVLNNNVHDIVDLKFNMVLIMYLSNMWNNDYDYQQKLIEANHYYETSPYRSKKKSIGSQVGKIQVSHGYSVHGDEK